MSPVSASGERDEFRRGGRERVGDGDERRGASGRGGGGERLGGRGRAGADGVELRDRLGRECAGHVVAFWCQNWNPEGNGSLGSSVYCAVPVTQARPVIVGTTAGLPPTSVSATSLPTKRLPMNDSFTKS